MNSQHPPRIGLLSVFHGKRPKSKKPRRSRVPRRSSVERLERRELLAADIALFASDDATIEEELNAQTCSPAVPSATSESSRASTADLFDNIHKVTPFSYRGEYRSARANLLKCLAEAEDPIWVAFFHRLIAKSFIEQGMVQEASKAFETASRIDPSPMSLTKEAEFKV